MCETSVKTVQDSPGLNIPSSSLLISVLETLVIAFLIISLCTPQKQDIRYAVLPQSKDAGVCASHSISLQKTHEKP
jgi:hypothetical protein